jgi:peroxiredoxin
MALKPGALAPDFTLTTREDSTNSQVTLSNNFGKSPTVLLFFPAAFSGTCTEELCSVSGGLAGSEVEGAIVYGISSDSPFAQEAWAKQAGISVPLLSDYTLAVAEAYGVILDDFLGLGPSNQRAVFVIDKEGIVQHVEVTASPGDLPDLAAMRAAVASL